MIVKVKEPQPQEIGLFRPGQIVFTYFHFAADRDLTQACLEAGITAIAYETINDKHGRLPLLTPMSEVAGSMSIQEGAKYLERPQEGPGDPAGRRARRRAGECGRSSAAASSAPTPPKSPPASAPTSSSWTSTSIACAISTTSCPPTCTRSISDPHTIRDQIRQADLVIGAVLIPGARRRGWCTTEDLADMKNGAVIVDVAIDQGGCIETSRPTTHQQPTYVVDGVVHYCVTNMPGGRRPHQHCRVVQRDAAVRTEDRKQGYEKAAAEDPGFAERINLVAGRVTNGAVAESFHMPCTPIKG